MRTDRNLLIRFSRCDALSVTVWFGQMSKKNSRNRVFEYLAGIKGHAMAEAPTLVGRALLYVQGSGLLPSFFLIDQFSIPDHIFHHISVTGASRAC